MNTKLEYTEDYFNHLDDGSIIKLDQLVKTLEESLKQGIVHFAYVKSNGELRKAIGTKCAKYMPDIPPRDSNKPKKAPNESVITYYDFEAQAPRAMKKESLIAIF